MKSYQVYWKDIWGIKHNDSILSTSHTKAKQQQHEINNTKSKYNLFPHLSKTNN